MHSCVICSQCIVSTCAWCRLTDLLHKVSKVLTHKVLTHTFRFACQAYHYDVVIKGLRRGGPPAPEEVESSQAPGPARPERPLPAGTCRCGSFLSSWCSALPYLHACSYKGQMHLRVPTPVLHAISGYTSSSILQTCAWQLMPAVQGSAPQVLCCVECRRVMAALAEQQHFPEHQWAYDGQKILYTARIFLPQAETVYEVSRLFALSVPMRMLNLITYLLQKTLHICKLADCNLVSKSTTPPYS